MMEKIDGLDADDFCSVVGSDGKLFVEASRIACERDVSNEATDELPQVLWHELCYIGKRDFVKLLQRHRERLFPFFGADGMDDIQGFR